MPKLNIAESAIEKYLNHICADYVKWSTPRRNDNPVVEDMIKKFCGSVRYEVGSKYIKVISGDSVHSFIVNNLKGKFPLGSILKAASWRAPATNFKRGCVLSEDFSRVSWTGAL